MRKLSALILVLAASLFALERQPNDVYHKRREALVQKVGNPVLLFAPTESEGPNNLYGFRQEDDFYYLTGLTDPGAALLIAPATKAGEQPAHGYIEVLFLPGRNVTQEKWTGPKLNPETPDARQQTGFDQIAPLDSIREVLVKTLPQPRAVVYTDTDVESASHGPIEWLHRANAFPNYIGFRDVKDDLHKMRLVKEAGEIELVKKATDASVAAHMAALREMRPSKTEQQISAVMQYEFLNHGCERPAYAPIVGSGFNGTVLHYSKNSSTIKDGDLVVMDVAGEYSMYASDITRTLPANGKFTPRQREIYDIVYGAQQAAIQQFKLGMTRADLKKIAMDYINSHGKDKHGQPLGQYFIHGLSHNIGLNVHDPGPDIPIVPGMIFSNEPGIYIPEESLGVRIEDVMLVSQDGKLVNLSAAAPSKADDIERMMSQRVGAASTGTR
jgi:Xaa-Pro aminopeptidase